MIRKAEDPGLIPYKNVPIIAVTATEMVGDRDRAIEAGMNDFTLKPLHNDTLRQILERFLNTEATTGDFCRIDSMRSFEPHMKEGSTPTTPGSTSTGKTMTTVMESKR